MPSRVTRRETLLALGGLGVWSGLRPLEAGWRWRGGRRRDEAIGRLADSLRVASRERAFELAADAIREGATIETLLGAVFRVGVEDVRPRPHGILHTVMMVHSSFELAEGAGEREAWLAALWNLDDLKTAQQRDREEFDDWSMPPRPDARAKSPEAARTELARAMNAWDPDRADRAVVALLPHVDHESFFELMWPFALRCNAFIGHKVIYAAQMERTLRRLSWSQAEPAARSLVRTLLVDRDTELWEANLERAEELPTKEPSGRAGDAAALASYRRSRGSDADDSIAAVLDALGDGVDAETAWDAMRVFASEIFHRRSGRRSNRGRDALLPVHALTVVNALGHVARTTRSRALSGLCLLEAAGRLPGMRDWLIDSTGLAAEGPPLEELGAGVGDEEVGLEDALAAGSPALVCAHLRGGTTSLERYGARLRTPLLRGALEHHQHKYAAAMLEEGRRASADLRPLILAPGAEYLAHPSDGVTELHERSLAALRRAGVE